MHPTAEEIDKLLQHCTLTLGRASGPGGQNRNKVETAVVYTHTATGVSGAANERRSQAENRKMAVRRLRVNLALAERGYFNLREVPTELWRARLQRGGKLVINPRHADYPALLAEAMDVIDDLRFDVGRAANLLDCTASQLLKLLRHEPRAMIWLNEQRAEHGMHALK